MKGLLGVFLCTCLIIWFLLIPVLSALIVSYPISWGGILAPWMPEGKEGNWTPNQKYTLQTRILPLGTPLNISDLICRKFDFYELTNQFLNNDKGAQQDIVYAVAALIGGKKIQ